MCFSIIFLLASINVVAFAEGNGISSAGTSSQQVSPENSSSTQVSPSQASKKSFNLRPSSDSNATSSDAATKVNSPATNSQNKVNTAQSSTSSRAAVSSSSPVTQNQPSSSTAQSTPPKQSASVQQNSPATPTPTTQSQPQQKSSSAPATQASPQGQVEPVKTESEAEKPSEEVASTKTTTEKKEEKSQVPDDLPKVDSSEMDFPEVAAPSTAQEQANSINYWAGLIGWTCLLIGVAIIIFVMLKGRSNLEMPVQKVHGSKRRRHKKKHLLSDDYYRDKF